MGRIVKAKSFSNLQKLLQVEEPLLFYPRKCVFEYQLLWPAPVDWEGEDFEVGHPPLAE